MAIWHVSVNGVPACESPVLAADDRLEPPICGSRNRARAEQYADLLRSRHPDSLIEVVEYGCPMRGE
jgi:hypothetical protein